MERLHYRIRAEICLKAIFLTDEIEKTDLGWFCGHSLLLKRRALPKATFKKDDTDDFVKNITKCI